MHITIIAVGKVREPYLKEGLELFRSRLTTYHSVSFVDLPEKRIREQDSEKLRSLAAMAEWGRILDTGSGSAVTIALDQNGILISSKDFASRMNDFEVEGKGSVAFLIGGPLGIPAAVLQKADIVLSLSRMTFPHQMVRLFLLEQLYRTACINRNIPYHK